jgi:hypothetical protein
MFRIQFIALKKPLLRPEKVYVYVDPSKLSLVLVRNRNSRGPNRIRQVSRPLLANVISNCIALSYMFRRIS